MEYANTVARHVLQEKWLMLKAVNVHEIVNLTSTGAEWTQLIGCIVTLAAQH